MKFKEFRKWCDERAMDGRWGFREAITCTDAYIMMYRVPFWKREKVWKTHTARPILEEIVESTNLLIEASQQYKVF